MCMICSLRNPSDPLAALDQHIATGGVVPAAANPNDDVWRGFGRVNETADAAESTSTAYNLLVGQSGFGTISSTTDEDWYRIELQAGVTYDFRLLGFGTNFLYDPLLLLMSASGTQIISNDDGFTSSAPSSPSDTHDRDSRMTYTATATGTYYLNADAYSTFTGSYLLTATERNPNGMVFTVDEIAWQLINNGVAFFSSPEGASFNVGADNTLTVNVLALTGQGQFLARQALAVWSAYTGIRFQETNGVAEITFDDSESGAFADPIYSGTRITSSTVNIGLDWLTEFGTTLQSYSFETYLHEIGHALGLGHGGNYNGSADFGSDNFYVNDSIAWSIMSYMNAENDEFDEGGPNDWNTYVNASFRYVYSPMIADMIAIQYLYGASGTAFAGNTTYGFGANTGVMAIDQAANSGALMAMTVFDSGGIDTLNFANSTANQTISLAQESLSSVLGGRNNFGIARGSVIEHATGGAGNDTVTGNSSANLLRGNGGDDLLAGYSGNDTLQGGGGADALYGGAGHNQLYGDDGNDLLQAGNEGDLMGGGAGNDTLHGGAGADSMYGAAGRNQLYGNGGHDYLQAGDAGDLIGGGAGNDTIRGGAGADTIYGGTGNENIGGGEGHDLIYGVDGSNILWGGVGNDTVYGGTGADEIYGGTGRNQLYGNAGSDFLQAGTQGDILGGGEGNDTIRGGAGVDTIYGGTGKDLLTGNGGADVFVFTAAAAIGIGALRDVITDFTPGVDHIDLRALDTTFNSSGTLTGGGVRSFYHYAPGGLLIGDQNGDGVADWVLELANKPNLVAGDILI